MSTFHQRTGLDARFKEIAREFFSIFLPDKVHFHLIGVEEELADVHEHLRFKRDPTTEFIRYRPDTFVCWDKAYAKPSWLIELKTALTGFQYDQAWPLREMRRQVPDLKKEEVANMELGAFQNLVRLRSLGLNVVVWLYVAYHPQRWLALLPEAELNLRALEREAMRRTAGSGTPIANVFIRVDGVRVWTLPAWLAATFAVAEADVAAFLTEREARLQLRDGASESG